MESIPPPTQYILENVYIMGYSFLPHIHKCKLHIEDKHNTFSVIQW